MLSGIAWVARDGSASVAVAAIAALSLSFVAGYIRARGAALGYSVEERHVTRGARYALVMAFLLFGWTWAVWVVAVMSGLAASCARGRSRRRSGRRERAASGPARPRRISSIGS